MGLDTRGASAYTGGMITGAEVATAWGAYLMARRKKMTLLEIAARLRVEARETWTGLYRERWGADLVLVS